MAQSFDDYRYEVQRIIDCGDDEVLVEATEVGRGASEWRRGSLDQLRAAHDPATGLIVRIREYYDEGEALEAAGLSE